MHTQTCIMGVFILGAGVGFKVSWLLQTQTWDRDNAAALGKMNFPWRTSSTNPSLSSSLLSVSLLSASGEVLLLWEGSSFSPLNSPFRVTSVTMATTTEPSLGYPYHCRKTAPRACNISVTLTENRPLLFVLLWRMVARTRALPDQVRWRLLHSSLNQAPDRERRRMGSTSVCSRILQLLQDQVKEQTITTPLPANVSWLQTASQTKHTLVSHFHQVSYSANEKQSYSMC